MVKLHIAARVIPEQIYLRSVELGIPEGRQLEGEKKLKVIVRNPDETWYVGTLARQVQDQFKRLYKRELNVKYLKDDADDCDLDPEQLVSDVFVDEGAAENDGRDQHVTIKVIREDERQDYGVRAGSVVPDLDRPQYLQSVRPPVPRFEDVSSTLGKRTLEDDALGLRGSKRSKAIEIPESQAGNHVVASIETDEVQGSPELIQDTQISRSWLHREEHSKGQSHIHEDIPRQSPDAENAAPFPLSRRNLPNGSHPFTPPSEPHNRTASLARSVSYNARNVSRSPLPQVSSAAKRFKQPTPKVANRYPESDIDDSQMSPASRNAKLPTPKLVNKNYKRASLQEIEDQAGEGFLPRPQVQSAKLLETQPENQNLPKNTAGDQQTPEDSQDEDENDSEDAEMQETARNSSRLVGARVEGNSTESPLSGQDATHSEAEANDAVDVAQSEQQQSTSESVSDDAEKQVTVVSRNDQQNQVEQEDSDDGSATSDNSSIAQTTAKPVLDSALLEVPKGKRKRPRTPDSPGEQLSQSLRESARKVPVPSRPNGKDESTVRKSDQPRPEIEAAKQGAGAQKEGLKAATPKANLNKSGSAQKSQPKVGASCMSCRKSKQKCDRIQGKNPCSHCEKTGRDCVVPDSTTTSVTPSRAETKAGTTNKTPSVKAIPASSSLSVLSAAKKSGAVKKADLLHVPASASKREQSTTSDASESATPVLPPSKPDTTKNTSAANKSDLLDVPAPPIEREQSFTSDTSESKRPVLPPGMTQAEYDKIMQDRSQPGYKLNLGTKKRLSKKADEAQKDMPKVTLTAQAAAPIPQVSKSLLGSSLSESSSTSNSKGSRDTNESRSSSSATPTTKSASVKIANGSTTVKRIATAAVPSPAPSSNTKRNPSVNGTVAKSPPKQVTPMKPPATSVAQRSSNIKLGAAPTTLGSAKTLADMRKAVQTSKERNVPPSSAKAAPIRAAALFSTHSSSEDDSDDDDDSESGDDKGTSKPRSQVASLVVPDPTIRDRSVEDDDDEDEEDE